MKKQTAFQWYMEQHNIIVRLYDNISVEERFDRFQDIIKKTQEMEKEQIKQSWVSAWQDSMINPKEYRFYEPDAEQYYDETYGGNK